MYSKFNYNKLPNYSLSHVLTTNQKKTMTQTKIIKKFIKNHLKILEIFTLSFFLLSVSYTSAQNIRVKGEKKKWHKIVLEITGPQASESGNPNPFADYKLTGIFTNGSTTYTVPGFFAADGNAAETSATAGNKWHINFAPDQTGTWEYTIRFRRGNGVAIRDNISAGSAVAGLDNLTGSFTISPTDKTGKDLRGKGRLTYVGAHYLRFKETNEWFIKAGVDSPENLLHYEDFDATPDAYVDKEPFKGNHLKSWSAHQQHYNNDGSTWKNGKGSEILGAVNYLASKGLNVFSFLTFNVRGDDRNVFPHLLKTSIQQYENFGLHDRWFRALHHDRFDVSKLEQWERLFEHGDKKGMYLHFKLNETEDERTFDNAYFGDERKIYYREIIARFGHHLALNWNIGEEVGNFLQPHSARVQIINYINSIDPYKHNLLVQTGGVDEHDAFEDLLGNTKITGASIKSSPWQASHRFTLEWRRKSAQASKKWVVSVDEQNPAQDGVQPDNVNNSNKHEIRKKVLWGTFMAGGAGVEYYFGYEYENNDVTCQDYTTRSDTWDYCRHALNFFNTYLPFWDMQPADNILSHNDAYALKKEGEVYAVYLERGNRSTTVDLAQGNYTIKWYNPRSGGNLLNGSVTTVTGGNNKSIGNPPNNNSNDWVALIRSQANNVPVNNVTVTPAALTLRRGQTGTLTETIAPVNATNKNVTWSSSNTNIATVSNDGMVTAVAPGVAEITVTTVNRNRTAVSTVTVTGNTPVSRVELSPNTLNIDIGETESLLATIFPANATNKNVTWSSSDPNIATVNTSGEVTGVAAGNATITVTTRNRNRMATSAITVSSGANDRVTSNTLPASVPRTGTLTFEVGHETTEPRDIVVALSGPGTPRVNFGRVRKTVNGTGTTSFSIDIVDNPPAGNNYRWVIFMAPIGKRWKDRIGNVVRRNNINVIGNIAVTGITISPVTVSLAINEFATLNATIQPNNATNQNITWSSSDTSIATVDSSGSVFGVAEGSVTITATTDDGNFIATATAQIRDDSQNNNCNGYEEQNGLIIMEAENTASDLGEWEFQTNLPNAKGSGHLQFLGNTISNGPVNSELEYTFTINKAGNYRLLLGSRRFVTPTGETDKSNDCYIKMTGDFTAPTGLPNTISFNNLSRFTKTVAGGFTNWGYKTIVWQGRELQTVYNFKAGETYTLTMAGRSKLFAVDRILLYNIEDYDFAEAQRNGMRINDETLCSQNSSLLIQNSEPTNQLSRISVHPNPVINQLQIKNNNNNHWTLYTINGIKVLDGNSNNINMQPYSSGAYILKTERGQYLKVIKQ